MEEAMNKSLETEPDSVLEAAIAESLRISEAEARTEEALLARAIAESKANFEAEQTQAQAQARLLAESSSADAAAGGLPDDDDLATALQISLRDDQITIQEQQAALLEEYATSSARALDELSEVRGREESGVGGRLDVAKGVGAISLEGAGATGEQNFVETSDGREICSGEESGGCDVAEGDRGSELADVSGENNGARDSGRGNVTVRSEEISVAEKSGRDVVERSVGNDVPENSEASNLAKVGVAASGQEFVRTVAVACNAERGNSPAKSTVTSTFSPKPPANDRELARAVELSVRESQLTVLEQQAALVEEYAPLEKARPQLDDRSSCKAGTVAALSTKSCSGHSDRMKGESGSSVPDTDPALAHRSSKQTSIKPGEDVDGNWLRGQRRRRRVRSYSFSPRVFPRLSNLIVNLTEFSFLQRLSPLGCNRRSKCCVPVWRRQEQVFCEGSQDCHRFFLYAR